jgi:hypothetical protein
MQINVRLLPLKGSVVEKKIEIPSDGFTIQKLIEAALPMIGKIMPMAGHSVFVNNLCLKEEWKRVASFHPDDVLTVMEVPLSIVMP